MKNYMMHFPLELATVLATLHVTILKNSHFVTNFCMTLTIHIYLSDGRRPRGLTTLESGWPFGNFARKTANGQ